MLKKKLLLTGLAAAIAAPAAFAAPGTPNIGWMESSLSNGAGVTTTWNMWWGENGTSWTLNDGTTAICTGALTPNGSNAQSGTCTVDLAAGSHALQVSLCNDSGCTTGNTVNVNVDGVIVPPPQEPSVAVSAATQVDLGTVVTVTASAADTDGTVVSVDFYAGDTLISTSTQAPYSASYTADQLGAVTLKAVATDNDGLTAQSVSTLNVIDPNVIIEPPVVANLTVSPMNPTEGDEVTLSVDATDTDGQVVNVSFAVDGQTIATDTTAPYSATWAAVKGTHTITATATDNDGAMAQSPAASLMVAEKDIPVNLVKPSTPALAWMGPAQIANGSATVNISWNIWSGQNGNLWRILEDGVSIHEASLADNTPSAQTGSYDVVKTTAHPGHSYQVEVCNSDGVDEICAQSASKVVEVLYDPDDLSTYNPWEMLDTTEWEARKAAGPRENNNVYVNSTGKQVGAYFTEWGVYGRNYEPKHMPVENLTHIYYGFIPVCGPNTSLTLESAKTALQQQCADKQDYEVVIHDTWAALGITSFDGSSKDADPIKGTYGEMYRLKKTFPHIKILPSMGGWTLSDPFYAIANEAGPRKIFIDSAIEFIDTWDFYDGIDIDWEFPGGGGANPDLGSPSDADAFAVLMKELRVALDELEIKNGREYELTAAMNGGVEKLSRVNWEEAAPVMDMINLMTYDYYGAWSNTFGHQTGLYPTAGSYNKDGTVGPEGFPGTTPLAGYTIDESITYLTTERSIPSSKLSVGVAMYGRGWKNIENGAVEGPFDGNATGGEAMTGTQEEGYWEKGIADYKGIERTKMGGPNGTGINGFTLFWDDTAKASYLWNQATGTLVTFDTARSIAEKGKYVLNNQLGGVFAWEIDSDNGILLNAMHESLGHK